MRASFKSFGLGLILSVLLVYLILVAQFQSLVDPLLILLAVPTGLTGVLLTLLLTGTTLNVMSLMGVVMMVGIVVSNSILIVEFTRRLREDGKSLREAVALACRVRLRPVLMTSLATLIGLLPMAAETRHRQRSLCAARSRDHRRVGVSVVLTVFIVPAAYFLIYRPKAAAASPRWQNEIHPSRHSKFKVQCLRFKVSCLFVLLLLLACRAEVPSVGRSSIFAPVNTPLLTLSQAHETALKNHPRISFADLRALAARQVTREARSAFFRSVWQCRRRRNGSRKHAARGHRWIQQSKHLQSQCRRPERYPTDHRLQPYSQPRRQRQTPRRSRRKQRPSHPRANPS